MRFFDATSLLDLYTQEISETDKTVQILNDVSDAIEENKEVLGKLNLYNYIISFGVLVLILGFIIASILFFITLGNI